MAASIGGVGIRDFVTGADIHRAEAVPPRPEQLPIPDLIERLQVAGCVPSGWKPQMSIGERRQVTVRAFETGIGTVSAFVRRAVNLAGETAPYPVRSLDPSAVTRADEVDDAAVWAAFSTIVGTEGDIGSLIAQMTQMLLLTGRCWVVETGDEWAVVAHECVTAPDTIGDGDSVTWKTGGRSGEATYRESAWFFGIESVSGGDHMGPMMDVAPLIALDEMVWAQVAELQRLIPVLANIIVGPDAEAVAVVDGVKTHVEWPSVLSGTIKHATSAGAVPLPPMVATSKPADFKKLDLSSNVLEQLQAVSGAVSAAIAERVMGDTGMNKAGLSDASQWNAAEMGRDYLAAWLGPFVRRHVLGPLSQTIFRRALASAGVSEPWRLDTNWQALSRPPNMAAIVHQGVEQGIFRPEALSEVLGLPESLLMREGTDEYEAWAARQAARTAPKPVGEWDSRQPVGPGGETDQGVAPELTIVEPIAPVRRADTWDFR